MDTPSEDLPPRKQKPFLKICRSAARAIGEYRMIAEGDRLLLGLSGGEDSLMLMHVLDHLRRRSPVRFEVVPALVDMGFPDLRRDLLREYCRSLGWDLRVVEIDGAGILEAHHAGDKPCALCSRLRRGKLHGLADELRCGKIALGHHLDDLCASFLLSLFRGGGLKTMGPNVAADAGSKRLIRPFCTTAKADIRAAALPFGLPAVGSCPFERRLRERGDRRCLEELLDRLDRRFPHVRSAMLRSLGDVRAGHLLDHRFLSESGDPDAGRL